MKNKIIIIALLFLSASLPAQILPVEVSEKPLVSRDEFGEGYTLSFEQGRNEIVNNITADLYFQGKTKYEEGDFISAKNLLVEFVDSEIIAVDMNSGVLPPYNKYRVYKYEACMMLKEIYNKEKNYKRSYHYYMSALKNYKYGLGCGYLDQNITEDDVYLFNCYLAIGKKDEALSKILGKIFTAKDTSPALTMEVVNLLLKENIKEYLREELTKSVANFVPEKKYFQFLNYKMSILLYDENIFTKEEENKAALRKIQNSLFYKLIMEN